jgi:Flp pilus assembly protein TadG
MGYSIDSVPKVLRDRGGTSLVEFAICLPVLVVFMTAIADFGRGLSSRYALQQSINRALEISQVEGASNDYSYLSAEVAAAANVPLANVTFQQWSECNGKLQVWEDDCVSGTSSRFVRLTVKRTYQPFFPAMNFFEKDSAGEVVFGAHGSLQVR